MAQHYPSFDFDTSLFHHPPSPPPSYYNTPPSYSYPPRTNDDQKSSAIASFPDDGISFPPAANPTSVQHPARDSCRSASRITIAHPYARLYAKKDGSKRRKIWNHVLEKQLFSPQELSTMGAPHRPSVSIRSLSKRLDPYRGLNSKTAKSMVAGLQHDATHVKLKLLELERSNTNLRKLLGTHNPSKASLSHPSAPSAMALEADVRRHSVDISGMGMGVHAGHNSTNHLHRS
ncbi:hypothetical protein JVT61DRAFT_5634 [Boletus reticuloceps]|uniref:Uncharacterized protein n=1 Tax=Boletus reticuloceps TaxID=495285 RepID=A0A8I3AG69_9AGAM|nr:hypothetical protein JVT61DRAFT_5634 [Boletus reticuloceps]